MSYEVEFYPLAPVADIIGSRLFGYDQGVMGGLLDLEVFYTQFPEINAHYETDTPDPGVNAINSRINNQHSTNQGKAYDMLIGLVEINIPQVLLSLRIMLAAS